MNTKEEIKEKNETSSLSLFLKLKDLKASTKKLDPPNPDFALNFMNGDLVGIELVRLFKPKLKEIENISREAVNQIWKETQSDSNLNGLHLTINFITKFPKKFTQKDIETDLKSVIDKVSSYFNSIPLYRTRHFNKFFDFDSIYINRIGVFKGLNRSGYWSISGGCVKENVHSIPFGVKGNDFLTEQIIKKNNKPKSYTLKFKEIWLLIYSEENSSSSLFDFENINHKIYDSKFDKIFLMGEGIINELNTNNLRNK